MAARIDRYFIVAGNHAEYQTWLWKNRSRFPDNNLNDFIYVNRPMVFLGYANPHGFFVGTFSQRPDLFEIIQTIIINSHSMSNQTKSDLINRVLPPAYPAP